MDDIRQDGGIGEIAGALSPEGENLRDPNFQFFIPPGLARRIETGHGGGFVFDARSIPNPGREERFKPLTGKDEPVIDYLNQHESVHQFFASAMSLVEASMSAIRVAGLKA